MNFGISATGSIFQDLVCGAAQLHKSLRFQFYSLVEPVTKQLE